MKKLIAVIFAVLVIFTFVDEIYGPDFEPLCDVIAKNKLSPTIICESAGTQSDDALSMKKYYLEQLKWKKLKMQKSKCSGLDFKMKEKFHQSTYKTEYCRKRGFTQMLDNKIDEN